MTIHPGRWSADLRTLERDDLVVFLIGARLNRPWHLRALWQVMTAMPRMLRLLAQDPDLGMLHAEHFRRGRTTLALTYWRSHEDLQRFATDRSLPHAPAWAAFNRTVAASGAVGIWHETYVVPRGNAEAIYGDMPRFGLARATAHVPVEQVGRRASERLAHAAGTPQPG